MPKDKSSDVVEPATEPEVAAVRSPRVTNPAAWALCALLAALVVVAIVATSFYGSSLGRESALVKSNEYQAVFLTNGQVYFGKLNTVNHNYYRLSDIFYLQVQQAVQPTGTTATTAPAADGSSAQTQLVKLGDELHGPEDSMQINRTQVQFWENLKNNGKVAQAIQSYSKG